MYFSFQFSSQLLNNVSLNKTCTLRKACLQQATQAQYITPNINLQLDKWEQKWENIENGITSVKQCCYLHTDNFK